ncbi:MAG: hypothetical protein ABIG39_06360 [Candidatus Micrarchaeota archaeon]
MVNLNAVVYAVCFVLFLVGIAFIYYLSKITQYNEASENRTRRRIEDVAYYLSKLEEHIEDVEAQIHKKIDSSELETRIKLTTYDQIITRVSKHTKKSRKAVAQ